MILLSLNIFFGTLSEKLKNLFVFGILSAPLNAFVCCFFVLILYICYSQTFYDGYLVVWTFEVSGRGEYLTGPNTCKK